MIPPALCSGDSGEAGLDGVDVDAAELSEILSQFDGEDAAVDGLEELLREAAAFRENPVDVNSAGLGELLRVTFLDPASAVRIVSARDTLGSFGSLDALVARGCVSREVLTRVRPYLVTRTRHVHVAPVRFIGPTVPASAAATPGASAFSWEARVRAISQERWDDSWGERGFVTGTGSFARLRVSYDDRLDASFACERDVGETAFADHCALSVVWRTRQEDSCDAPAVSLGAGDFVGSWGQGLMLRSGGFPSEAAYPRRRDSVRRYDGAGESTARRGLFLTASRGLATVRALLARTAVDAAIGEDGLATSLRSTGYHRTEGEKQGESSLDESLVGVRLSVEAAAGLELSASLMRVGYSPGLAPGDPVRQHFAFSGEEQTAGGCDVRASFGDLTAACEAVRTSSGGTAALAAVRLERRSARVRVGAAAMSRDYWSPLGGGTPGFSSGSNGAVGWASAEYLATGGWKVWASARATGRPWRSFHSELPNGSSYVGIGGEIRTKNGWRFTVESRSRSRTDSGGDPTATRGSAARRVRATLRTGGSSPVDLSVWKSASFSEGPEVGSLIAVSLRFGGGIGSRGSYDAGLTSVAVRGDAPSLVCYEPRLPGEFGLVSLNASGTRWYIRIRTGLPSGCGLSVRLSGGPERGRMQFGVGLDAKGG